MIVNIFMFPFKKGNIYPLGKSVISPAADVSDIEFINGTAITWSVVSGPPAAG